VTNKLIKGLAAAGQITRVHIQWHVITNTTYVYVYVWCLTNVLCSLQDPHFKVANHRRRIIQPTLLTEYAHIMAPGGWLYTITDVPELGEWMVRAVLCEV
jgi:tRNA G46 methylase TrmB